ncbi:long-chain-fatty-acid-- ligase [Leptolyngbya sp. Heron Island J]|uniref:AMP-dependent synthetase/ligase n=1 Tax=Leptolyngbya sp. Heron Island J TaxID=1385935 RepID=UPI0003B98974|nr:AMP-binding protein [Leptolyngbya sp. Heron Island J]ESA34710.1 long-chain-fatty-acid-- ligase [Leptolyngbya sp. Heron Island J]
MVDRCPLCCLLYVAPATKGAVQLHYTIPDLLDMGCAYAPMPVLHQWTVHGWKAYTYSEFRTAAEELALGLNSERLTWANDDHELARIGLLLESDIHWALVDMAGAIAHLVTVPIDKGQPADTIGWIVADADLKALVVSTWKTLKRFYHQVQQVKLIIVVEEASPPVWALSQPEIKTLTEIRRQGHRLYSAEAIQALRQQLHPDDLTTIVYNPDASGHVKGTMLSHRSLTGNIWAAFSSMPGLMPGTPEVALSFLPLNHIFARAFLYGHFGFGHHIYFSSPKRVFSHLATVKPTIFITVPRLLEKVYERVNSLRQQSQGLKQYWLNWGWHLAHRADLRRDGWRRLRPWLLGHSVFNTLRRAFGGNMRYLLCGGAALRSEIMTFFNGIGIPVKQGYGLTETSSVLTYTRDRWLRSGTVGVPIPGVEMRLAADGEVLAHSPYTMTGYHHDPEATDAVIDADGWFHTGDLGEFSVDGLLTLHGCKKELFKLSTGKYVAPAAIEAQLEKSPFVKRALLVGPGQKFCGVLMVPEVRTLKQSLQSQGDSWASRELPLEELSDAGGGADVVRSHYQTLIDQINSQLPSWSTIKRFALVNEKAGTSRQQRYQLYAQEVESLYQEAEPGRQVRPSRFSRLYQRWRRWGNWYRHDQRMA